MCKVSGLILWAGRSFKAGIMGLTALKVLWISSMKSDGTRPFVQIMNTIFMVQLQWPYIVWQKSKWSPRTFILCGNNLQNVEGRKAQLHLLCGSLLQISVVLNRLFSCSVWGRAHVVLKSANSYRRIIQSLIVKYGTLISTKARPTYQVETYLHIYTYITHVQEIENSRRHKEPFFW